MTILVAPIWYNMGISIEIAFLFGVQSQLILSVYLQSLLHTDSEMQVFGRFKDATKIYSKKQVTRFHMSKVQASRLEKKDTESERNSIVCK